MNTRWFPEHFKEKLVHSLQNRDEECNGLLVNSENFQALKLLLPKYQHSVQCIYIDPPYNTKSSEILYKNNYRHSSWMSLLSDRMFVSKKFLMTNCSVVIAIDEVEQEVLGQLITSLFPGWTKTCIPVEHNRRGQQGKNVSYVHEFTYFVYPSDNQKVLADVRRKTIDDRDLQDSGTESDRNNAKNCFYPIVVQDKKITGIGSVPEVSFHPTSSNVTREDGSVEIWPIDASGNEKKWRYARSSVNSIIDELYVKEGRHSLKIYKTKQFSTMRSLWKGKKFDASQHGTKLLQDILGKKQAALFSNPKSIFTVLEALTAQFNNSKSGIVLDYFAGSGTTAQATIEMNRQDKGDRKFILMEVGRHFDTVLIPRISKVTYSESWRGGKPCNRHSGISQCFKYIRLESYEDTLNNLEFDNSEIRKNLLKENSSLNEDFMLHYWLDVELRESQSLLNIKNFKDPRAYTLKVKQQGTDEYVTKKVDLIETFNYLIGLRVKHISMSQCFDADFKFIQDPELPEDQEPKLVVDRLSEKCNGKWWFRKVKGWVPKNRFSPNNGEKESILIIWRNLTDNIQEDNLVLNAWFEEIRNSDKEFDFDIVYVNGSSTLHTLKKTHERWKLHLLEHEFLRCMWDTTEMK